MASKLTSEQRQAYARAFAERLSSSYFIGKNKISGEELLKVSPVEQVNLMMLYAIFAAWKKQQASARSPFFNYEASAVKEAENNYMNTLSRHILVEKNDFTQLLEKAVDESLWLLYEPADYLSHLSDKGELKAKVRYIKFHRVAALAVVENSRQPVADILSQLTPDNPQAAEERFAEVLPLPVREEERPAENKEEEAGDFFSQYGLGSALEEQSVGKKPDEQRKQEIVSSKEAGISTAARQEADKATVLHERLANQHQPAQQKPLYENLRKKDSLRNNIGLNQRFMFIQELFQGNQSAYSDALDRLDACQNLQEAEKLVQDDLQLRYNWEEESEAAQEFNDLLSARFA